MDYDKLVIEYISKELAMLDERDGWRLRVDGNQVENEAERVKIGLNKPDNIDIVLIGETDQGESSSKILRLDWGGVVSNLISIDNRIKARLRALKRQNADIDEYRR